MAHGKLALRLCLIGACAGLASCGRSSPVARSNGSGVDSGGRADSTAAPAADAVSERDASGATDTASGRDGSSADDAAFGKDSFDAADVTSGTDALVTSSGDTQISTCGNGIYDPGEECDDGNTLSGDGCTNLCKLECGYNCSCFDPTAICRPLVVCGDGVRSSSEACDDGNVESGDGCSANCEVEAHWRCHVPGRRCTPICGDGILLGTETCDDGNTIAGDGCGENCLIGGGGQYCGDGVVSGAEECDDGALNNDVEYGVCTTRCQYSLCGDGIVNGSEACDLGDGHNNAMYGDPQGCTSECSRPHFCGDGFLDSDYGEECDLGAINGKTYCSSNCWMYVD